MTTTTNWPLIERILAHVQFTRMTLFGPPGVSKTFVAQQVLSNDLPGMPMYALTITEDTPAAELRGHFVPTGPGEFGWLDGPALRWWNTGGRLILDEVDKAGPDLLSLLLCVLNDPKLAALTLPTGETVRPNPAAKWPWQVVATMNGTPDDLPDPLRERLMPMVEVTVPHPGAFAILPPGIREAAQAGVVAAHDRRVALREWQALVGLLNMGVDPEDAYRLMWGEGGIGVYEAVQLISIGDRPTAAE